MTSVLAHPTTDLPAPTPPTTPPGRWQRPIWNRFSALQLLVLGAATIAPAVIVSAIVGRLLGVLSTEAMMDIALGAGEEPGMFTFAAMFLASPVQWLTGRTQVRVRKYLGIVFFLLALSNGAMFAIEAGIGAALSAPFLVAGTLALALSTPLFLTSSRRSQRMLGMKRWQLLHRATYLIAVALVVHVLLVPEEIGLSVGLIALGFVLRVPPVRRWLSARTAKKRDLGPTDSRRRAG